MRKNRIKRKGKLNSVIEVLIKGVVGKRVYKEAFESDELVSSNDLCHRLVLY